MRLLPTAIALLTATALVGGCDRGPAGPSGGTPPPSAAPTSDSHSVSTGPTTAGSRPTAAATGRVVWPTDPVTVIRTPAVPPVPVVTALRYAAHAADGYERVVLDITGAQPGYSVRYVSQVTGDGSGRPITVPGKAYLLIALTPAQAHTDAGKTTITGVHSTNLPMLAGYAVAGDFEGHVMIALGLNAKTGFRIGEAPGRIYVDVATR